MNRQEAIQKVKNLRGKEVEYKGEFYRIGEVVESPNGQAGVSLHGDRGSRWLDERNGGLYTLIGILFPQSQILTEHQKYLRDFPKYDPRD